MAGPAWKEPCLDTIVIGVDFGPECEIGLEFVHRHLKAESNFVLVHALHLPLDAEHRGGETSAQIAIREEAEHSAREALESIGAKSLGAKAANIVVIPGEAAHVLAVVADDVSADLIVIGPHRETARMERILGTTAQKLIHEVHTPVLMATHPIAQAPRKILAPVAPAEGPDRVSAWTKLLSEKTGAEVIAMNVVKQPVRTIISTVHDQGIDLIVMGSHGPGLIERLFRANVADLVLAETPVPVLIVR